MITRRNLLKALALSCATVSTAPTIAATHKLSSAHLHPRIPPHACDCHSHIIGPYSRYPMIEARTYTPPTASVGELKAMHAALGIERSVLVQPSFYGTDNSCLLDALTALGPTARGVAVIPASPLSSEIDRLREAGVVGIRVNQTGGSKDPGTLKRRVERAARQAAEQDWIVQIFFPLHTIASMADIIEASPAPFVLDHFAGADATGVHQEGMDRVLGLVKDGKAYVKLSAMYHQAAAPDYPGMGELATAFIAANLRRVLWATDWPHTDPRKAPGRTKDDVNPFYSIDDMNLLEHFFAWVPDPAVRATILADNPAHLFKFG
jgi:predicted TIM-barrel fold metal-dependent hydrolase